MPVWIVCRKCGDKEWVQSHTPFVHCQKCQAPRFAEDDSGRPLIVWSEYQDPDKWEVASFSPKASL